MNEYRLVHSTAMYDFYITATGDAKRTHKKTGATEAVLPYRNPTGKRDRLRFSKLNKFVDDWIKIAFS